MKSIKSIVFVAISIAFVSSCTVMSFYPLYTDEVIISDDRIIGSWQSTAYELFGDNDEDTLQWYIYKQDRAEAFYTLKMYMNEDKERFSTFKLHLVELDGKKYLDFYPIDADVENVFFAAHLLFVHTFAKIEIGEELQITWFDSDWLEKLFEENKIRIKHEQNSENILLTAKSEELQKFITKYSNDEKAFSEGMRFTLRKF